MIRAYVTWRFEPVDFFEAPAEIELPLGVLSVASGKAELVADSATRRDGRPFLKEATEAVTAVFALRSIQTDRLYNLVHAGFVEVDTEGKRHYTVFPDPARIAIRGSPVDVIITDAQGNVKVDSRAERIRRDLTDIATVAPKVTHSAMLARMAASYVESLNDPDNALVHLYEIRDAAVSMFGSADQTRAALGISARAWSELGRIANDEPIRQGRHRGKMKGPLRNVTQAELGTCRAVAQDIIRAAAGRVQ